MIKKLFTQTFDNGDIETVTLEKWSDDDYFINMNCQMWNKRFKTLRGALNYLNKSGYKEVII